MKKSIVLTLLILFVFTTGCGLMPGTELYLSQTLNVLGLWSVYYKTGRITIKFDESYALTGDENYYDLISLIRNGDQQDKDQMAVYVFCGEDDIYQGHDAVFDSSKLTISFSIDDIGKDIYYILITHKERQFGIDVEDPHYFEQYNIKPITVEKYCNHVYCPDYLFTDNEKINKSLINCIESQGRFQYTDIDHAYCTYLLKYETSSDRLYFEYIINDHFLIDVDAHTGEIINIDEWCASQWRYKSL